MRDMEIRGAGDILGVNQHGTIKVVGMNHFLRMLNKTIEELKAGRFYTFYGKLPPLEVLERMMLGALSAGFVTGAVIFEEPAKAPLFTQWEMVRMWFYLPYFAT